MRPAIVKHKKNFYLMCASSIDIETAKSDSAGQNSAPADTTIMESCT